MDKDLKKVVVLLAHPNMENSQANKALLDAIKGYRRCGYI